MGGKKSPFSRSATASSSVSLSSGSMSLGMCAMPARNTARTIVHSDERAPSLWENDKIAVQERFPMMTVAAELFLTLETLRPFQEMMQSNIIRPLQEHSKAIFVSHQWLGRFHPDPDGEQLRCLQGFLSEIAEGKAKNMFSEQEWATFTTGTASARRSGSDSDQVLTFQDERQAQIKGAFRTYNRDAVDMLTASDISLISLWIDYMSVPQDVTGDDESQIEAIYSIPYYIERSSFFIVVCPRAQHKDTGEICEYGTWLQRGWCRFEEWANILSCHHAVPLVLTGRQVWTMDLVEYFMFRGHTRAGSIACGDFTCCDLNHEREDGTPMPCDKESLLSILEKMWNVKVDEVTQSTQDWEWPFVHIKGVETQLFARSEEDPFHATWATLAEDISPDLVLQRIEVDCVEGRTGCSVPFVAAHLGDERVLQACAEADSYDPLEVNGHGSTPLMLAVRSGSPAAVEWLLSMPAMTVEHVNLREGETGRTALHFAAINGYSSLVVMLLRFSADVACRRKNGWTPLHSAASHGHWKTVQALLEAAAPVDAQDFSQATPLHYAARGFSLWGSRKGKKRAVRCLLDHRASVAIVDQDGLSAGDVARRDQFKAAADIIFDPGRVAALAAAAFVERRRVSRPSALWSEPAMSASLRSSRCTASE